MSSATTDTVGHGRTRSRERCHLIITNLDGRPQRGRFADAAIDSYRPRSTRGATRPSNGIRAHSCVLEQHPGRQLVAWASEAAVLTITGHNTSITGSSCVYTVYTAVLPEALTYCGSARRITCPDHDSGSLCGSTELVYAAVFTEQHAMCRVQSSIGRKKAPRSFEAFIRPDVCVSAVRSQRSL